MLAIVMTILTSTVLAMQAPYPRVATVVFPILGLAIISRLDFFKNAISLTLGGDKWVLWGPGGLVNKLKVAELVEVRAHWTLPSVDEPGQAWVELASAHRLGIALGPWDSKEGQLEAERVRDWIRGQLQAQCGVSRHVLRTEQKRSRRAAPWTVVHFALHSLP